jgi:hypothetical protein
MHGLEARVTMNSLTLIIDGIWGRPWRWEKLRKRIESTVGPAEIFWYDATGLKGLDVLGGRLMEKIARADGRVNVVAHSMGCLVARAARLHAPDFHFNRAVFMNGPLSGTFAAYCLPLPAIRQMRPGSEFLRSLDLVERDWKTPTMVTWCRGDVMILPNRSMRWEHATCEHRFRMPAHAWPRWSRRVQNSILSFLCEKQPVTLAA